MQSDWGPTAEMVSETFLSIGCLTLLAGLGSSAGLNAFFGVKGTERLLHFYEELALGATHLIVLFHRSPKFSNYQWVSVCS